MSTLKKKKPRGNSPAVQWLGLHTSNCRGHEFDPWSSLISGQGTKIPQTIQQGQKRKSKQNTTTKIHNLARNRNESDDPACKARDCPNLWQCEHYTALMISEQLSSVQFSRSVMSDSLWPHESQHARPPCPSQTPGVYSNSCPSSRWCHPAISSSVVPFSSCPQSLPASGSFPMSQLHNWARISNGC